MSANALLTYKDLRITTSHKHQVMQDWGDESHDSVTKRLANGPMIMHGQDFRSLQQEGLGINHEEWKKAKESHVH